MRQDEARGLIFVALAVALFSTSPLFALLADPLSPFVKTGGRMLIAAAALGAVLWIRGRLRDRARSRAVAGPPVLEPPGEIAPAPDPATARPAARLRRGALVRFALYGLIAAAHFLGYIASLSFTSPAHSLTIVYTAPVFVALISAAFLREPLRARQWAGMVVAIAGVAVLANPFGGAGGLPESWLAGDLLALGSALAFAIYSVAGRYERDRYDLFTYAAGVYTAAALWLLPAFLLTLPAPDRLPALGLDPWLAVAALGLFPLALGHTLYNASLRRVHAAYVNIIAAQEVTGGILLVWWLLGIAPNPTDLVGAGITLVGILIVLL